MSGPPAISGWICAKSCGSLFSAAHTPPPLPSLPRRRLHTSAVYAATAREQLQRIRARNLTCLAVVALRSPQLLAQMVAEPVEANGRPIGPPTMEELAYVGRQADLTEEQVGAWGMM
jgi:hypothetical protein